MIYVHRTFANIGFLQQELLLFSTGSIAEYTCYILSTN
uniref:Uncharacterized protein n=1 Tax=Arundo donax TaxID=35708 RepID=A0A0A9FJC4_ARUDO